MAIRVLKVWYGAALHKPATCAPIVYVGTDDETVASEFYNEQLQDRLGELLEGAEEKELTISQIRESVEKGEWVSALRFFFSEYETHDMYFAFECSLVRGEEN